MSSASRKTAAGLAIAANLVCGLVIFVHFLRSLASYLNDASWGFFYILTASLAALSYGFVTTAFYHGDARKPDDFSPRNIFTVLCTLYNYELIMLAAVCQAILAFGWIPSTNGVVVNFFAASFNGVLIAMFFSNLLRNTFEFSVAGEERSMFTMLLQICSNIVGYIILFPSVFFLYVLTSTQDATASSAQSVLVLPGFPAWQYTELTVTFALSVIVVLGFLFIRYVLQPEAIQTVGQNSALSSSNIARNLISIIVALLLTIATFITAYISTLALFRLTASNSILLNSSYIIYGELLRIVSVMLIAIVYQGFAYIRVNNKLTLLHITGNVTVALFMMALMAASLVVISAPNLPTIVYQVGAFVSLISTAMAPYIATRYALTYSLSSLKKGSEIEDHYRNNTFIGALLMSMFMLALYDNRHKGPLFSVWSARPMIMAYIGLGLAAAVMLFMIILIGYAPLCSKIRDLRNKTKTPATTN